MRIFRGPALLGPALLTALLLIAAVLSLGTPAATAAGFVTVDDFAGTTLGTRTVTATGGGGTSTPATFSESGGQGTVHAYGDGNTATGIRLDYSFPSTDLTAGGANTELRVEFDYLSRSSQEPGTAALVSVEITDVRGFSGSLSTGLPEGASSLVASFAGLDLGSVDMTRATQITVTIAYPQNYDLGPILVAVLETIQATPAGGVVPAPPVPALTGPSHDPVVGPSGSTVDYQLSFTSGGNPAPVTLTAADLTALGSAPGHDQLALTGGPSTYTLTVGPLTGSGTIGVEVPVGAATDDYGQSNTTSTTLTTTFLLTTVPAITSGTPPPASVDTYYEHQFTATGAPTPSYTLASGSLPTWLSLTSDGKLSGTPTTDGEYTFTVRAANVAGHDDQTVHLEVNSQPVFTSPSTVTLGRGDAGSPFMIEASGHPAPTITTADALPPGLSLADNHDGTATVAGIPTASGDYVLHLTADNGIGAAATQDLTVVVTEAPGFTSPAQAPFAVGAPGSFTVTTTGHPNAAISAGGPLPAGLTLTDNGDGTATLAGTPTVPGSVAVTLTATSPLGTATQELDVVVTAPPRFVSADRATFVVGEQGSFTLSADGFPPPRLTTDGEPPEGLVFTDNGDGTATLAGTPGPDTAGTHRLTIVASSGSVPAAPRGSLASRVGAGSAPATALQVLTVEIGAAPEQPTQDTDDTGDTGGAEEGAGSSQSDPDHNGQGGDQDAGGADAGSPGLPDTGAPGLGTALPAIALVGLGLVLIGRERRRSAGA